MTDNNPLQALLRSEKLDEAIEHLNAQVRSNPMSIDQRALLAELLCVAGNLERADTVLNAITNIDPGAMVGVALFRQLVRAEQARQQFYSEGRVPEFVVKPDALLALELRAAVALREGDFGEVNTLLAEREAARTPVACVADGDPADDFRDLDDLCAAHLEIFSSTGKYFWIAVANIVALEFRKPETRRDLLWRRAQLTVADGPDGEVFLPCIYAAKEMTFAHRLGHQTDFTDLAERATLGTGLRTFLVGDSSKTILELGKVTFTLQAARA
jgi:type VI secretion system protein ImpE